MKKHKGFVGVDFDKTLATHKNGHGPLGRPLAPMQRRVKNMLARGTNVVVFTARPKSDHKKISNWTKENLGKRLRVTNVKSPAMYKFYDDKAVAVTPNTGRLKRG